MLTIGSIVHVTLAGAPAEEPALRGTVINANEHTFTVLFTEAVDPVVGTDAAVCSDGCGEFRRITATVHAVLGSAPHPTIRFEIVDEQEQANQRTLFRVSVAGALLDAIIDGTPGCALIDLSPEGFAIVTPASFGVGDVVSAALEHDGRVFSGRAVVQSVQALDQRRYRYGLHAPKSEHSLREGLQQITISVQRQQLRHIADRKLDLT